MTRPLPGAGRLRRPAQRRQRLRPPGAGRAGRARLGRGHPRGRLGPTSPRCCPAVPDGALVLVDRLVVSWAADDLLAEAAAGAPRAAGAHGRSRRRASASCSPPSAAVVTTSGWSRRWLLEHYGLDADRLHVAVPGVEVADPVPGPTAGGELLCVASVLPAKGHDVLLAALAALTDLDWRCTLVGPLDLDPDFVDELHKSAADSGIADRVVFAGRARRTTTSGAAYAGADAAGAALAGRELRDGRDRGAGPRPAGGRERGRRRTGSTRARRRRQHPRAAGAAGRPRRPGRRTAPLARGPAAPAAAAPFGRAAAADAARRGRGPPPRSPPRWRRRDDERDRGSSPQPRLAGLRDWAQSALGARPARSRAGSVARVWRCSGSWSGSSGPGRSWTGCARPARGRSRWRWW